MPEMSDILETTKIASRAFSWMKELENGQVSEDVRLGKISVEKAEFNEKNGNEMLHIRIDEDTEFWAIKTKDNKQILALKEEEQYLYYAVTGNEDKQLTLMSQEDMFAQLKIDTPSYNQSVTDIFIQTTENGKQADISSQVVAKDNDLAIKTKIVADNEKVSETSYSVKSNGDVKVKGYGISGAFEGKSKILDSAQREKGTFFEAKVLDGTTVINNEIWRCKDGELSLVGVINKEADKNSKSLRVAGKNISYQPVSDLPSDELDYIVDKAKSNKEEILETLGGQHITTNDILYGNALKDDLKAQQPDLGKNPTAKARQARLGLRLASREQSGDETQDITPTVAHNSEAQVDLMPQKER